MNLTLIENKLLISCRATGISVYDFEFERFFSCTHPYQIAEGTAVLLRLGAVTNYEQTYATYCEAGLIPLLSPAQHLLASELSQWYPLLTDLTPRTCIYEALPGPDELEAAFTWPVFIKGSRQTSKHNPEQAIVRDRIQYERVRARYQTDPILRWQKPAVRVFESLLPVAGSVPGKISASMEFRSFWWHQRCVGVGPYWYQAPTYQTADLDQGLALAEIAVRRLALPFLVVDFAKTVDGRWIIIECNDAQESGYAGIAPIRLWQQVLDLIHVGSPKY